MKNLSILLRGGLILVALLPAHAAWSDERPDPHKVGEYLGISLSCGCLARDSDFLTAFYYAIFAEDYGQSYAQIMVGEMRYNARMTWHNQAALCAEICPSEIIANMAYLVDHAGRAMASSVFRQHFDDAQARYSPNVASADDAEPGNYGIWQTCYWRPNSPLCKDIDDPASPIGE